MVCLVQEEKQKIETGKRALFVCCVVDLLMQLFSFQTLEQDNVSATKDHVFLGSFFRLN